MQFSEAMDLFMSLFSGRRTAYGKYLLTNEIDERGKVKGRPSTEIGPINKDLYSSHLMGVEGLGIIPINENNKCVFGVIDFDSIGDNKEIIDAIYKHEIPLVPFRSKSGGLHLYMFLKEETKAKEVIDVLKEIRSILGLPEKTEIFPKQISVKEGKIGNWINLPYFNHKETTRYMINRVHEKESFETMVVYCDQSRKTIREIRDTLSLLPLSDAPPCLQHIFLFGETNARNLYLFSIAKYYKTKNGDSFDKNVMSANLSLNAPLDASEIANIVQSHKKRDYTYKCTDEPIKDLCSKGICESRKFGISSGAISDFTFEELVQWKSDPPYYEWTINGKTLQFYDENEIMNQLNFMRLCMRELHKLPKRLSEPAWLGIVRTALENIVVKEVAKEDDMSPGALFMEYLVEFLTKRAMAENKEQLLVDKVFYDKEQRGYIFKAKNLILFLVYQKQFRFFGQTEIHSRLRKLSAVPLRTYINENNKNARMWFIPEKSISSFEEAKQSDVLYDFKEEYKDEQY